VSRRFDTLAMGNRAFELLRIWEAEWNTYRTRDRSIVPMARDRVDRTRRAADYLYRRLRRMEAAGTLN
jgi:hypothetical protein